MSSILKALQKLESETLEKGNGQSWLHHFNAGEKSPEKRGWIRRKYRLALLCIGLIISGSAVYMFTSSRPPEIAVTNEARAPIRAAALDGVNEISAPEPKPTGGPAGGPAISRDTIKSEKTYPEKTSGPAARMGKEVPSTGPEKSEPSPAPPETSGISMQPGPVESPDTALNANQAESVLNNRPQAVETPQSQISAKRIQTPDINLHAISWTPDVKTRIAVINGSIVREGDTISRYRVSKINKDDVILSEGGELWRLGFRGK